MANNYKNIVITPNRDTLANDVPFIRFSGGDATLNTDINLRVYTTQSGTLSFEGSAGQLFSITNDLTNTIFSVNDVSGIPSIDVNANGIVQLVPFNGNVAVGRTTANYKLDVAGSVNASAFFINGVATNIQGIQGTTGLQGIQGVQGTSGLQGLQGVQGTNGLQGIQGVQGTTGLQGIQGVQGTNGIQGFQGVQGRQGTQGLQGDRGLQGIQGLQGDRGLQGFQGLQGDRGFQGIQGVQGTNGLQGFQGLQGVQGPTGPSTLINATSVTVNDTVFPVFVTDAGSNQTAQTSPGFSYNPSSNTLFVTGNVLVNRTDSTVGLNTKVDVNGAVNAAAYLVNGFSLGNQFSVRSSNYTAINGDRLLCDTSAGTFIVTLPASPATGTVVTIYDRASFTTNPLTVARNGSTIEGIADDFSLDIGQTRTEFVYDGSTWHVYSSIGPRGLPDTISTASSIAYGVALG